MRNRYAIQPSVIAKAITRNSQCLNSLIDFISRGKVKFYSEVPLREIELNQEIGRGTSSKIYDGIYEGKKVAIKFIKEEKQEEILKEISFL